MCVLPVAILTAGLVTHTWRFSQHACCTVLRSRGRGFVASGAYHGKNKMNGNVAHATYSTGTAAAKSENKKVHTAHHTNRCRSWWLTTFDCRPCSCSRLGQGTVAGMQTIAAA